LRVSKHTKLEAETWFYGKKNPHLVQTTRSGLVNASSTTFLHGYLKDDLYNSATQNTNTMNELGIDMIARKIVRSA
jgi:hypothetical protein